MPKVIYIHGKEKSGKTSTLNKLALHLKNMSMKYPSTNGEKNLKRQIIYIPLNMKQRTV